MRQIFIHAVFIVSLVSISVEGWADEVFHFREEKVAETPVGSVAVDGDGLWKVPVSTTGKNGKESQIPVGAVKSETKKRKLELALRELKILKKAAENAGGDLNIIIEPVGISSDDLFIQLTQLGYFELSQKNDGQVLRIESRMSDPYLETLKGQIISLEKRRAALMNHIDILEKLIRQNKEQFEPIQNVGISNSEDETTAGADLSRPVSSDSAPIEVTIILSPRVKVMPQ